MKSLIIGTMSGTSADGIDVACLTFCENEIIDAKKQHFLAYDPDLTKQILNLAANKITNLLEIKLIEQKITDFHIKAIKQFLDKYHLKPSQIDLISLSGHTILHNVKHKISWQIIDADKITHHFKIKAIANLRILDILNGGQGAPLVASYHQFLFKNHPKPLAVLNIGGVSNITFLKEDNSYIAFDIGVGNAPLNDLISDKLQINFDQDGNLAKQGKINQELAQNFLNTPFFSQKPPKTIDRNDFNQYLQQINQLSLNDALATICFIIAKQVQVAINLVNIKPNSIYIHGGGRKNQVIIKNLQQILQQIEIKDVDEININGDFIEAQAFAFLARHFLGK